METSTALLFDDFHLAVVNSVLSAAIGETHNVTDAARSSKSSSFPVGDGWTEGGTTDRWGPCGYFGFRFFLNTVLIGLLCLLGIAGNTISIVVLQKDRHNRVAVFLLQALAIADNSVLVLCFVTLSLFYGLIPVVVDQSIVATHLRPVFLQFINPLGSMARSSAIWLTVLLAVNRYLAVCRPFTSDRWLTLAYARVQVALVVAASVGFNLPRVFYCYEHSDMLPWCRSSSISYSHNGTGYRDVNETSCYLQSQPEVAAVGPKTGNGGGASSFTLIYLNIVYTSVVLVLPLILLVIFNVPLIRQMQRSKLRMRRSSLSYSGNQENNITVVMIVIIVELIVCHTPDRVVQIVLYILRDANTPAEAKRLSDCPEVMFFLINVSNLLVIVNSSTDFIVYYVFRRRFRRILFQKLFCCPPVAAASASGEGGRPGGATAAAPGRVEGRAKGEAGVDGGGFGAAVELDGNGVGNGRGRHDRGSKAAAAAGEQIGLRTTLKLNKLRGKKRDSHRDVLIKQDTFL